MSAGNNILSTSCIDICEEQQQLQMYIKHNRMLLTPVFTSLSEVFNKSEFSMLWVFFERNNRIYWLMQVFS